MARPLRARPAGEVVVEASRSDCGTAPAREPPGLAKESAQSSTGDLHAEFERSKLLHASRLDPVGRVAAFLVVLSVQNGHEGRDAATIHDSLDCVSVANAIGFELDVLSRGLLVLQERRLVEPDHSGRWRILDIDGLKRLADYEHQDSETPPSSGSARIEAPKLRILARGPWSAFASEMRELGWLLLYMAGLSIISVGAGIAAAIAIL